MAIDTVKLRSPYVTQSVAAAVEERLVTRTAVDRPTGELLYELTAGSLEGSWESRISVKVCRDEWVSTRRLSNPKQVDTVLRPCEPYIEVEGSVHKALIGHNVYGGPCDFVASCRWFIAHLALQLGCELPGADSWLVRRVDWAEIYELPYAAIEQYVHGLNNAAFPRRSVTRYGDQSLSCPGTTSTVKLYHKGPEFSKHDYRRLRPLMNVQQQRDGYLVNLQNRANELLRVETTVKARKLDDDFEHPPTVRELTEAYLVTVHEREVARLLREGGATMKTVRKHREVHDRLCEFYGEDSRLVGLLFGTWFQLAALGEKVTRENMKRATFYLHRKQLQDAGVAWHGGDVRVVEVASILPADFSPVRSDPRRVTGEDLRVVELLAPYREKVA